MHNIYQFIFLSYLNIFKYFQYFYHIDLMWLTEEPPPSINHCWKDLEPGYLCSWCWKVSFYFSNHVINNWVVHFDTKLCFPSGAACCPRVEAMTAPVFGRGRSSELKLYGACLSSFNHVNFLTSRSSPWLQLLINIGGQQEKSLPGAGEKMWLREGLLLI